METLKILDKKEHINWDYDEEADVLYLSINKPRPAIGIDTGDGIIVRYDEKRKEVVGLTIIGFKERSLKAMA
jgi:uncharacterized protein YuzE